MKTLIISTEPAPYKTDLYNAICDVATDVLVVYASSRSWEWDAGHNYNEFPSRKYQFVLNSGKGFLGQLLSGLSVIVNIIKFRPDNVLICTYNRIPYILAIFFSISFRIPFSVWDDHFNTGKTHMKGILPQWIRYIIRKAIFKYAKRILVCGKYGRETAILAGCPSNKLSNFPYVVEKKRMIQNALDSQSFKDSNLPVILYSGRFIERKGLPVLLKSLHILISRGGFHLVIEGDGPLKNEYRQLVKEYDLDHITTFTGFNQMRVHSRLIYDSDIIVVPSISDPWGIVVQEGMMLGKVVVASDSVGSAKDLIVDGVNGYKFPCGDHIYLAECLQKLISDKSLRNKIGHEACNSSLVITPEKNASIFIDSVTDHILT